MKVLLRNNICYLDNLENKCSTAFLDFRYFSGAQKKFFEKALNQLVKNYPSIEFRPVEEKLGSFDLALAWDAIDEISEYGREKIAPQNRLFKYLDFEFTDSFSNFKKKAEKHLVSYYDDFITPRDQDVKKRIDFYFDSEEQFPSSYFETRNEMLGDSFSTQFSPYLALGTLDVRYLYNCVKDYESKIGENKSTYWIIFELLWREFFYWHYQKHGRKYFLSGGLSGEHKSTPPKNYSFKKLRSFSDNSFFRASLNELEHTGYPSNRTRQMFASFWLNDLGLDWLSGAKLYEKTLIDYDVYSNYGNWMYLAGVGVDPRGKRYFKIDKQLERYDPSGSYLKKWL